MKQILTLMIVSVIALSSCNNNTKTTETETQSGKTTVEQTATGNTEEKSTINTFETENSSTTDGIKTYKNIEKGFEISYNTKDFQEIDTGHPNIDISLLNTKLKSNISVATIPLSDTDEFTNLQEYIDGVVDLAKSNPQMTNIKQEAITINGIKGFTVSYEVKVEEDTVSSIQYVLENNNVLYVITLIISPDDKTNELSNIAHSFKFIK